MSRLNVGNLYNENEDGSPNISGISTFSSTHYFVPPSGSTAERPSFADPGMIRFNTDSGHLEYYNGVEWTSVIVNNQELGISNNAAGTSGGLGVRGVFSGIGGYPTISNVMNYVNVETTGNAIDFGDLTLPTRYGNAVGSRTRGIVYEAITPSSTYDTDIQYFTFASTGNTIDFGGNSTAGRYGALGLSNSTRGLRGGGNTPSGNSNVIDYITMASTGVDAQDFGDLIVSFRYGNGSCASSTRGIMTGGYQGGGSGNDNSISFVTISTQGNAQDFGDLSLARNSGSQGGSNSVRGIFCGGHTPTSVNTIDFVTIATLGDAQDFGDLSSATELGATAASKTRLVIALGDYPSYVDTIEYVQIMTTGNAVDFGNLTITGGDSGNNMGNSNGHGGL